MTILNLWVYDLYSQHQTGRTLILAERHRCSSLLPACRFNRLAHIIPVTLDCLQVCICKASDLICFEHKSEPSIADIHEIAAAILFYPRSFSVQLSHRGAASLCYMHWSILHHVEVSAGRGRGIWKWKVDKGRRTMKNLENHCCAPLPCGLLLGLLWPPQRWAGLWTWFKMFMLRHADLKSDDFYRSKKASCETRWGRQDEGGGRETSCDHHPWRFKTAPEGHMPWRMVIKSVMNGRL